MNLASGVDIRMLVRQALKQQPQPTVTVLSSLLAVQDAVHYLPDEAIEETAGFCGTTVNEVWSVASFLHELSFHAARGPYVGSVLGAYLPSCRGAGTSVDCPGGVRHRSGKGRPKTGARLFAITRASGRAHRRRSFP